MHLGQLVELSPTENLFYSPKHLYTEALMSAIPEVNSDQEMEPVHLAGEIPSPINPSSGCRFHTRCPYIQDKCKIGVPAWEEIAPKHFVACHLTNTITLKGAEMPTSVDAI